MADFPSTNVRINSQLSPFTDTQTFPLFDSAHGLGGLRTVGTTAEMNAIFDRRRTRGMMVYVSGVSAYYALIGTTANSGWTTEFQIGTGTNILPLNNTFTGVNTFAGGLCASGGITFNSEIRGTTATFTTSVVSPQYLPAVAGGGITVGSIGGGGKASNLSLVSDNILIAPSTAWTPGASLGTASGITLTISSGNTMRVIPSGSFSVLPTAAAGGVGGSRPSFVVQNTDSANGQVQISGGDLYLGTKTDNSDVQTPTNIIFSNPTTTRVTTLTAPNTTTSHRTITLPDASGTVVVDSAATTFTAAQTFNAGLTASVLSTTGNATIGATLTVQGNFVVNGTTTIINSTTIEVDDKLILLAQGTTLDSALNDGGIELGSGAGATPKSLKWLQSTSAWTSSEDFNLVSGKVYEINGTTVLSSSALGTGITSSSLQSVGTISSGTWQGTQVGVQYGGTGLTLSAKGDLLVGGNSANTYTRLPVSTTNGQVLGTDGSDVAWRTIAIGNASGTSVATLNTGVYRIQDATSTLKGLASFDSFNFTVTSGLVDIAAIDGGVYA